MPRLAWRLVNGRPAVEIALRRPSDGQDWPRTLLADTGAGSLLSLGELILSEADCLICGGRPNRPVSLGGASTGSFPTYTVRVRIPGLGFDERVRTVGVARVPAGFDGLACFRFLNRFTSGNFGDANLIGLET